MDIVDISTILRVFTCSLCLVSVIIWGYFVKNGKRGYYFAIFLYSINAFIFGLLRIFNFLSTESHALWGNLLVFHSVIIVTSLGIIILRRRDYKKWTLH